MDARIDLDLDHYDALNCLGPASIDDAEGPSDRQSAGRDLSLWLSGVLSGYPNAYATAVGLSLLAVEATVHATVGFISAFEALYILPIWISTRIGGRWPGGLIAVLSALITTQFDIRLLGLNAMWPSLMVRLAAYGLVVLLIAEVESSLSRQLRLARTDPLTGLLNRRAFDERAQEALLGAQRSGETAAIAVIDCNEFKALNDLHGHGAGDQVLRILARSLAVGIRSSDLVARMGGDEFCILMRGVDVPQAKAITDRIEHSFESATRSAGFPSTICVGLAEVQKDCRSIGSAIAHADQAMYVRKGSSKRRGVPAWISRI